MSRNRLHVNKVGEFRDWLKTKGWTEQETKTCWEALRMTHPDHEVLIVHRKMRAKVHCTLHGVSEKMFTKWQRS